MNFIASFARELTAGKGMLTNYLLNYRVLTKFILFFRGRFQLKFPEGSNEHVFEFKASSDAEADSWVTAIQKHIENSEGHLR